MNRRKEYPLTYPIWKGMRARCSAPSFSHLNYQKKGIKVCQRWNNFLNFVQDMGRRPSSKHSIDRIDNDKDYSPSNCRWALVHTQVRNRGDFTKHYTYNGKTMCLKDWSEELGMKYTTMLRRVNIKKMSFLDGISTPSRYKNSMKTFIPVVLNKDIVQADTKVLE